MPINTKSQGDCGYVCFYKARRIELYAQSAYEAQQKAAKHFEARKAFEVNVILAEDANGNAVTHVPDF